MAVVCDGCDYDYDCVPVREEVGEMGAEARVRYTS